MELRFAFCNMLISFAFSHFHHSRSLWQMAALPVAEPGMRSVIKIYVNIT